MAAVEFAMVAPIFIAMMLGILQITLIFFAKETLETVTEAAARGVLTGQVKASGATQAQFHQAICDNYIPALFTCSGVMVDLQPAASLSNIDTSEPALTFSGGAVTNPWAFNTGTKGTVMVMRVMYQWPLFTGPLGINFSNLSNGNLLIMATAVFKNES